MSPRHTPRRAVLIIHGIGEQIPMGTLRAFVQAVFKPNKSPTYWSKPDTFSRSFELRVLKGRDRDHTDFYEYYWAHKLTGTRIGHVLSWLADLMLRPPWRVAVRLRVLWGLLWVLSLIALTALGSGLIRPPEPNAPGILKTLQGVLHRPWGLWSLMLAGGIMALQYFLVRYMGDVARYLSPKPENIDLRQKIRADGIEILKRLHKSGKYERIIVVGHSLGTVIGYDILRYYWSEVHATYSTPDRKGQPALKAVHELDGSIGHEVLNPLQESLLEEQERLGHPWRVSHFITTGSPLSHASMLMAADLAELRVRQDEKELPTCPPTKGGGDFIYTLKPPFTTAQGLTTLNTLDHAALFACTHWTNLYIPAHLGLFGDFIGGPLQGVFGTGIQDIPVQSTRFYGLASWTILGHVSYWDPATGLDPKIHDPATQALCEALAR